MEEKPTQAIFEHGQRIARLREQICSAMGMPSNYFGDILSFFQGMIDPFVQWYGRDCILTKAELRCWGKRLFNKRRPEWLSGEEIAQIRTAIKRKHGPKVGHL